MAKKITDFGNFDIDLDVDLDINLNLDYELGESRYIAPKKITPIKSKHIRFDKALDLGAKLKPTKDFRYDCIVNGKFEFGDFIEAFVCENDLILKELTVSTLSFSQNNIDSLGNLVYANRLDKLNILVSYYFYAHEKGGIPYALKELDTENLDFQIAVAEIHTKTALLETLDGRKFVMHGSGNLRSSGSIEHFCFEENADLYDFHYIFNSEILENFAIINKFVPKHDSTLEDLNNIKALRGAKINNLCKNGNR